MQSYTHTRCSNIACSRKSAYWVVVMFGALRFILCGDCAEDMEDALLEEAQGVR